MTIAFLLAESGHEVTVLEREKTVGGLARTFRYGDFLFDIGPHRFHTDDGDVLGLLRRVLSDNWTEIDRRSGVFLFGHYHDWPLRPGSLLKLPLPVMLGAGVDLFRRRDAENESFEDYILSMYGRTLYDFFFAPYTRKFILESPERIHADWAISGVDRAVIDRRVRMNTLSQVLRGTLLPRAVKTTFIYPGKGGVASFSSGLKSMVCARGGRVLEEQRVTGVSADGDQVRSVTTESGTEIPLDLLIWTAPITEIVRILGLEDTWLRYISTVCYNYAIDDPPRIPYQWCYYGQDDIPFNRLGVPSFFSPASAPPGKHGICAEVTCTEQSETWRDPDRFTGPIERHLAELDALRSPDRIEGLHVERIPNTYPVYRMGYREELDRVKGALAAFRNLRLLGRTGTFWYNNMDHSIRMAIDVAREIANHAGKAG
jgi:protoporphyrinogen oxidase